MISRYEIRGLRGVEDGLDRSAATGTAGGLSAP